MFNALTVWLFSLNWFWEEVILPIWWLWLVLFVWSCYRHYEIFCKEESE